MSSSWYQESVIGVRYCVEIAAAICILVWAFSGYVVFPEDNCPQIAREIELAEGKNAVASDCVPSKLENPVPLPFWAQVLYIPTGLLLAIFLLWNRGKPNYLMELVSAMLGASVLLQLFILLITL